MKLLNAYMSVIKASHLSAHSMLGEHICLDRINIFILIYTATFPPGILVVALRYVIHTFLIYLHVYLSTW